MSDEKELPHTVRVSAAMWNWAREHGKPGREGPATYIRSIVEERMANNKPSKSAPKEETPPWDEDDIPHWVTDRRLKELEDTQLAIDVFRKYRPEFYEEGGLRSGEEVDDFLESIDGYQYDELTEKQQNFLGLIRRQHADWVRKRVHKKT